MEMRRERIYIETAKQLIEGNLALPSEGYRSRTSDFLNARDREFLVLTDATILSLDNTGEAVQRDFVAVSVRHIVLVSELAVAPTE